MSPSRSHTFAHAERSAETASSFKDNELGPGSFKPQYPSETCMPILKPISLMMTKLFSFSVIFPFGFSSWKIHVIFLMTYAF